MLASVSSRGGSLTEDFGSWDAMTGKEDPGIHTKKKSES